MVLACCGLSPWDSWALECQWWQTKVKAATIPQHQREGNTVSSHPRQEHCRERWKGADHHINQFKDDPILGWSKEGEVFKKWTRIEIQTVLQLLPRLPSWARIEQVNFRRAKTSVYKGNSATSELTKKTIVLYDNFFTLEDKLSVIGHEASHFVFQELTTLDIVQFEKLSGWDIELKDRKVYIIAPKNPIMPDSVNDKEEDFANHAEMYISNPNKLNKINPKMYEFFLKRFPK